MVCPEETPRRCEKCQAVPCRSIQLLSSRVRPARPLQEAAQSSAQLRTVYLDREIRVGEGTSGNRFVFQRVAAQSGRRAEERAGRGSG